MRGYIRPVYNAAQTNSVEPSNCQKIQPSLRFVIVSLALPPCKEKGSRRKFGGPARIRTGDRQVSRTRGYEPAALSVLQPEENLAELRALQESRSLNSNS